MTLRSSEARFQKFHRDNPQVYNALVALARQATAKGRTRASIKMLWEVVRWHFFLETVTEEGDFKLNNNHHSRYARLIMAQEHDLRDMFVTRDLRTS